jgi:hypothetical protein
MSPYTPEELEKINKIKETNDKLEEFFNQRRIDWNKNIEPLFVVISSDITNPSNSRLLLDSQATALSYKQQIIEQINHFLNKRGREVSKVKKLKQDKFIFYATGFGVKTSLGEKGILIDGHIAEYDRTINLIESYIDYLRDTIKNLESFSFSIKHMIDLLNYLGK